MTDSTKTIPLTDQSVIDLELTHASDAPVSLVLYAPDGPRIVPLSEGQVVVIGRSAPADVVIGHRSLSREHACIALEDGQIWLEDLHSTNGTRVDGKRIDRFEVQAGADIVFGKISATIAVPRRGATHGKSHEEFRAVLDLEIARARAFRRPLALFMLRPAQRIPSGLWIPKLRASLRAFDTLGLYSHDTVEVLVPELDADAARALAEQLCQIHDLRCGLAVFPVYASSLEELLSTARSGLRQSSDGSRVGLAAAVAPESRGPEGAVVASPAMRAVYETVDRVATAVLPVLVLGETGTGKEVVARAIHERSKRARAPMVCVNCGAIPAQLLESHLFGHEKGAFTGATERAAGVFESADGGTVFLDEIGELPAPAQAALLRVLETKRLSRVGSTQEIEVDVRVLAATHRDLAAMVKDGSFREDLVYRLNAITLDVPPLRERTEEIELLAEAFLAQANEANERDVAGIEAAALDALRGYAWPGNVRELKNTIERAVVIAQEKQIRVDDLPDTICSKAVTTVVKSTSSDGDGRQSLKEQVAAFESGLIRAALDEVSWDRKRAAEVLGLPVRTLSYKMAQLGIAK